MSTSPRTTDPWVESPWLEDDIGRRELPPHIVELARLYHRDGYAVVSGLVDHDLIARILDDAVEPLRGAGRVQDLWRTSASVRELAVLPSVLDLLRTLYGREPVPFQTLSFEYGTQQRAHSDTVHFSSLPRGFMCGVWVALEDVDGGNGPLFYYPGSQRLPDPYFQRFGLEAGLASYGNYEDAQEALMTAHGLERVEFHAQAGDVLIWSSNLVHGGMPIAEAGRTRWSQVTHYFFEGCVYVTPLYSDPELGEWYVRHDLVDITTGRPAPQSYNGQAIHFEDLGNMRSRIHRGPMSAPHAAELRAELDALRHELGVARARADHAAAELAALRSSRALRTGNALLAPARWLRNRTRPC
ncbi:MAG: phytanoyl-CoA dioxygenase family protein [Actinobacteria bacterium]|nr:phytanoyl-CoA dioxygenase family protein [Actinomycetota bacterium]